MANSYDAIIIGAGPAGISAGLTLRQRNKSALIISNDFLQSPLAKAERVDNYPGMPGAGGRAMLEAFIAHAEGAGVSFEQKRCLSAMKSGDGFFVSAGSDVYESKSLIICTGIAQKRSFPGELKLLGSGVSYCATCDGLLYRGQRVGVIGTNLEAVHDANFLEEIGCEVYFFTNEKTKPGLSGSVNVITAREFELRGADRLEGLTADGVEYDLRCVFILRDTLSMSALMPSLETDNGLIKVTKQMECSVPGVFAAGDCTGAPYQIAKAVGEGNIAGLSCAKYLETYAHTER